MYQSGFKRNRSTDFCLAQLTDFVSTGMDKQMHTDMILDLQKAFDTLDHEVPLEDIKYFGFLTSVIKWFESYLSNTKYLVCIDNVFSEVGILKRCTTSLYSWTAPFSIICKGSSPIIITRRLLFV